MANYLMDVEHPLPGKSTKRKIPWPIFWTMGLLFSNHRILAADTPAFRHGEEATTQVVK